MGGGHRLYHPGPHCCAERSGGRAARAGQDRALGRFTGLADELRILRAVGRHERRRNTAVLELLDQRRIKLLSPVPDVNDAQYVLTALRRWLEAAAILKS